MEKNQKLISILIAILLAIVLGGGLVVWMLPAANAPEGTPPSGIQGTDQFDLRVLERREYRELQQRSVQDKSIPVPPPVTAGKANPFL